MPYAWAQMHGLTVLDQWLKDHAYLPLTIVCIGGLKPAVRNFTLSNSTDVYEASYMPVQLSANLKCCRGSPSQAFARHLIAFLRQQPFESFCGTPDDAHQSETKQTRKVPLPPVQQH